MDEKFSTILNDRTAIAISGIDAHDFLQRIVTANIDVVSDDKANDCALLSPQGKVDFQFLIWLNEDKYILDLPSSQAAELARKLSLYKLRAKVDIEVLSNFKIVASASQTELTPFLDNRADHMGFRGIISASQSASFADETSQYHARRIKCGVPELGADYESSERFVHEILLDQTGGVDFSKGCYVGQEVVSRVEHRSTARKRFVQLIGEEPLPAREQTLFQDDRKIGTMGSSASGIGLALLRLDKLTQPKVLDEHGKQYCVQLPPFVNFDILRGDT